MLYQKRVVKAPARGMTREAAMQSLKDSFGTKFPEGTEIIDFKRRGDKWAATLLEPHTAEFPPKDDDADSSDGPPQAEKSESGDGDSDSKGPSDSEKGPKPPEGEKGPGGLGEMAMMMDILTAIADKLGIVPGAAAPGAEDGPVPGEAPPPPPGPPAPTGGPPGAGGPGGPGHQEIVHKTKLKPGDTPPGVTPIGAPAFASTNSDLSRMASFDAFDDTPGKSIRQAKDELEALYGPHGFKVRQIKRVEGGTRLAAKLSRR